MALRTPPAWLQAGSYTAENDRLTAQASYTTTGIVGLSSMAVTAQASPNMTVNVASGWAAIVGGNATNQGAYLAYNDATTVLTVTSADPSLPRIDRVVATVSDAAYSGSANQVVFAVLAGTPNASPTAPAVPTNAISLATISIAAASTTIAQTAITDTRVPADSSLVYSKPGANAIINGDFAINQRAFTSTTSGGYGFDRFRVDQSGGTVTYSAQTFTPGSAPVVGYEAANFARIVTSGQSASTDYAVLRQSVEDVRTLAGQTVTVSFWAKTASGAPKIGVALEQQFGSGGSPSSAVINIVGNATLSTAWQRYSLTYSLPSIAGKTIGTSTNSSFLGVSLFVSLGTGLTTYGNIGIQNNTFDIWGVQVEAGSIATAFRRAAGTIQGELAACQRYYYRINAYGLNYAINFGSSISTSAAEFLFPKDMRAAATSLDYANLQIYRLAGITLSGVNTPVLDFATPTQTWVRFTGSAGQFTSTPENVQIIASASTSYLGFSAEL